MGKEGGSRLSGQKIAGGRWDDCGKPRGRMQGVEEDPKGVGVKPAPFLRPWGIEAWGALEAIAGLEGPEGSGMGTGEVDGGGCGPGCECAGARGCGRRCKAGSHRPGC